MPIKSKVLPVNCGALQTIVTATETDFSTAGRPADCSRSAAELVSPGSDAAEDGLDTLGKGSSVLQSHGLPLTQSVFLEEEAAVHQLEREVLYHQGHSKDAGFTLLHYVTLLCNTTLEHGLEAAARTDAAALRHCARIVRHLISTGHDVYTCDRYGCRPLQLAAAMGSTEIVDALLSPLKGISPEAEAAMEEYINHQDSQIRWTALHGALSHCRYDVAVLLLRYGANPQVADIMRNNAFQVAPSREALRELLHALVQAVQDSVSAVWADKAVQTTAMAQLMIEIIKQQHAAQALELQERQKQHAAQDAAAAAAAVGAGREFARKLKQSLLRSQKQALARTTLALPSGPLPAQHAPASPSAHAPMPPSRFAQHAQPAQPSRLSLVSTPLSPLLPTKENSDIEALRPPSLPGSPDIGQTNEALTPEPSSAVAAVAASAAAADEVAPSAQMSSCNEESAAAANGVIGTDDDDGGAAAQGLAGSNSPAATAEAAAAAAATPEGGVAAAQPLAAEVTESCAAMAIAGNATTVQSSSDNLEAVQPLPPASDGSSTGAMAVAATATGGTAPHSAGTAGKPAAGPAADMPKADAPDIVATGATAHADSEESPLALASRAARLPPMDGRTNSGCSSVAPNRISLPGSMTAAAAPSLLSRDRLLLGKSKRVSIEGVEQQRLATVADAAAAAQGPDRQQRSPPQPSAPCSPSTPSMRHKQRQQQQVGTLQASGNAVQDVAVIVQQLFQDLYKKGRYSDIWQYVKAAADYNNYVLAQMTLGLICTHCPKALAACDWHDAMAVVVVCFPNLFHQLLARLQGMSEADVRGFVRSLKLPAKDPLQNRRSSMRRVRSTVTALDGGAGGRSRLPLRPASAVLKSVLMPATGAAGGASGVHAGRHLPPRRGTSGVRPAAACAEAPVPGTVPQEVPEPHASLAAGGAMLYGGASVCIAQRNSLAMAGALPGGSSSGNSSLVLLYQQLVKGLKQLTSPWIVKLFFENLDEQLLKDMARYPVFQEFVALIALPPTVPGAAGNAGGSTAVQLLPLATPSVDMSLAGAAAAATAARDLAATAAAAVDGDGGSRRKVVEQLLDLLEGGSSGDSACNNNETAVSAAAINRWRNAVHQAPADSHPPAAGAPGQHSEQEVAQAQQAQNEQASSSSGNLRTSQMHMLHVRTVLSAAVHSGKSGHVEAAVAAVVDWVTVNSTPPGAAGRLGFASTAYSAAAMAACAAPVATAMQQQAGAQQQQHRAAANALICGIDSRLLRKLAWRFPASAARLLGLVTPAMLEQLVPVQVPSLLLRKQPMAVKCSDMRNPCMWRQAELSLLELPQNGGFTREMVDALADYGIPFEATHRAVMGTGTFRSDSARHRLPHSRNGAAGSVPADANSSMYLSTAADATPRPGTGTGPGSSRRLGIAGSDAGAAAAAASDGAAGGRRRGNGGSMAEMPGPMAFGVSGGGATRAQFAALIREGFTGPELRDLISNGILLARVVVAIEACKAAPAEGVEPLTALIKDMVARKLSFRIIEVILDAGPMDEATVYANFRPGHPLYHAYPAHLYKGGYKPAFVQLLLSNWRKGGGSAGLAPWDKAFIDSVFAPNDPLCAQLKSAYDNRLADVPLHVEGGEGEGDRSVARWWLQKRHQDLRLVVRAFVCNPLLVHRWPVFLAAMVLVAAWSWAMRFAHARGWDKRSSRRAGLLVDAKALIVPWQGLADMRSEEGLLHALVDTNAPTRWFGSLLVKAVILVKWQEYGQALMVMGACVHVMYMALFGAFLLVVRDVGQREGQNMAAVRAEPEVIAMLAVLGVLSLGQLMEEATQRSHLTLREWRSNLGNVIDLTSLTLFAVILALVCVGEPAVSDGNSWSYELVLSLGAVEALVLFVRLVLYASMTDSMGSLVRMVIEIIKDMRFFFALLAMLFGGFAMAFAVLEGPGNSYRNISFKLFTIMLGDFQSTDLEGVVDTPGAWYTPILAALLLSVYGILIGIVLINLLIAIMNDTYDRIKETEEVEVLRNRAELLVDLESLLTPSMRKQLQAQLLGQYLHVVVPADRKDVRWLAGEGVAGGPGGGGEGWQGRLRYLRAELRSDIEPLVQQVRSDVEALQSRNARLNDRLLGEVEALRKMVRSMHNHQTLLLASMAPGASTAADASTVAVAQQQQLQTTRSGKQRK